MAVVKEKCLPRIKVAVRDLKKVLDAYKTLGSVGVIDFTESGIFSGYINVIFDNYKLFGALYKDDVDFILNGFAECVYMDPALDETIADTKEGDIVTNLKATTMRLCEQIIEARRKGFNVEVSINSFVSQKGVHPVSVKVTKVTEY